MRGSLFTVGLLALLGVAGEVSAGPAPWHQGHAWEVAIEKGIAAQRSRAARSSSMDGILGQARRAARREASVENLYLLARAYGLRSQHRIAAARDATERRGSQDDRASAQSTYREVLQQAPRCYFAHHDLGVLALQADGRATKQAFAHFQASYRINDRYTPTLRQLVRLYVERKQHGVAVPILERLLQLEPKDAGARARLAVAYAHLGKYPASDRTFELLLKDPKTRAAWLLVRAQTETQTGRPARGLASWKQLARSNPNVPAPFLGMLACLGKLEETKEAVEPRDYLLALRGLRRIERDPKRRARLMADMQRIEQRLARPTVEPPRGPPTTAQLLQGLEAPAEATRVQALLILMLRKEPATAGVVRAIAGRIGPKAESAAAVRAGAMRALGRLGGTRLVPLLRHGLADPDLRVRLETVDTLVAIARRDPSAVGGVIAILGTQVIGTSTGTSIGYVSAVHQGLLALTSTTLLGVGRDSDATSWRHSFLAWWNGAEGLDTQIRALDGYHRVGDRAADQVLVPYLDSPGFFVFRAAYEALRRAARPAGAGEWARWWKRLPDAAGERPKKEQWASLKGEMEAWVRDRPGR